MQLPNYFQQRPPMDLDQETVRAFERLYTRYVADGDGREIEYSLDAPRWQFLCYLADTKDVVLHGSGHRDIVEFEPRQSNDVEEFGNRKAVYAASDGLWPMYFAIANRDGGVTSLLNACFRVIGKDGSKSEPYYFFSINDDAMQHEPWRNGTIYILPRATFEQQGREVRRELTTEIQQAASLVPVKPLAKLAIQPSDFPFLSSVRAHDLAVLSERATSHPDGFPWLDE